MSKRKTALVTGGCGFIGSNFIKYFLDNDLGGIVNLDCKTYAGRGRNLEHMGLSDNFLLQTIEGNISDPRIVRRVFSAIKPEIVFHFAAESHVDRSIGSADEFVRTNVLGTQNLLDAAVLHGVEKFVHISTDEVYGSLGPEDPQSREGDILRPRSPYAASKAAAEHLVMAAYHTHGLPTTITRCANNYGPYQFPEKLIPLFITNLIDGKKVPLMWSEENPGLNRRDWIHVEDHCKAIHFISEKGENGEVYNISGTQGTINIDLTKRLLNLFGLDEDRIQHVSHRKGHDFRYDVDEGKLKKLGYDSSKGTSLEEGLKDTVEWYKNNPSWWRQLKK